MSAAALLLAGQAAAAPYSPPPIVAVEPASKDTRPPAILPASARAVVDHMDALFKGDIDHALSFVSSDVENVISSPTGGTLNFPRGSMVTKAMYYSITRKQKLSLSWFDCQPQQAAVRCETKWGSGRDERSFTLTYFVNGGPITKIVSWENKKSKT